MKALAELRNVFEDDAPEEAPEEEEPVIPPLPNRSRAPEPVSGTNSETARKAPPDLGKVKEDLDSVFVLSPSTAGHWMPSVSSIENPNGAPGFPFRTVAAEKVFAMAKKLIPMFPNATAMQLMSDAVDKAQVLYTELTPEDVSLLELAIHYAQTGRDADFVTPPIVRTGNGVGNGPTLEPRGFR
jgi:hypothetical protein